MPRNQFQRAFFAFVTVLITVHAYVFYSLYVVNGDTLMTINQAPSVISAINKQGGVYMLGHYMPIWSVILVEFCLAYSLEMVLGSPFSFKMASKMFDPRETHPVIFETVIICSTVAIMCPAMSFIASFLYYPYYAGFNIFTLLANWIKLVCFNFPFAFFSQIFFIQPLVRRVFQFVFQKDIQQRAEGAQEPAVEETPEPALSNRKGKVAPDSMVIVDVMRMVNEIKEKLDAEYAEQIQ
jgi:hypothetical protein